MIIDCDTCTVRGEACSDCVVAVLMGAPPALDSDEQRAIAVLADSGLVPPLRLAPAPARSESAVSDHTPTVSDDTPSPSTRAV